MDEKMYKMFMFRAYVNKYLDKEVERNRKIYDHFESAAEGLYKLALDSKDDPLFLEIMNHLDQIKLCARRGMIEMKPKNFWEMIDNNLKES